MFHSNGNDFVTVLPHVISGWIGVLLIMAGCFASGYTGINIGRCWQMLLETYPEYHTQVRYPYQAIGQRAVGNWMGYFYLTCIHLSSVLRKKYDQN